MTECVGCGALHADGELVCASCANTETVHVAGETFVTEPIEGIAAKVAAETDEVNAAAFLVATADALENPTAFRLYRRARLSRAVINAANLARAIEALELTDAAERVMLRRLQLLIAVAQLRFDVRTP